MRARSRGHRVCTRHAHNQGARATIHQPPAGQQLPAEDHTHHSGITITLIVIIVIVSDTCDNSSYYYDNSTSSTDIP